ncbi:MAG: hypothetical protein LBT26_03525 [Clostridiales Family XIII bacterium]|nr:hypothetical protein [Clostridiales Family XIII bacterium]
MKNWTKRIIPLALAGVLVTVSFVSAFWNSDEAVHVSAGGIENSTLAIGTHLIHISALTQELYDIASASAGESGQDRVYYKSELSNGAWCDISGANALTAITGGAQGAFGTSARVSDTVIAALFFTHHTKSDGITYDLRTGQAVNIFDIRNPYDLELMEELSPLKMQYDLFVETQGESEQGTAKIARIDIFWQTSVEDQVTAECDADLAALQAYLDAIRPEGDTVRMGVVQERMDAVDAKRRAQVFTVLDEVLPVFIEELQTLTDTETENEDGESETTPGVASDTSLQSAVNESMSNVQAALIYQQGRMLAEGVTVLSAAAYQASNDLIDHAKAGNHAACDVDVEILVNLSDIENGRIVDKEAELALLRDSLISQATGRFTAALAAEADDDYRNAEAGQAAGAVLRAIAAESIGAMSICRSELEFLIDALTQRVTASEGMDYIDERLALTTGWYSAGGDVFKDGADACVTDHIDFLSRLKRTLQLAAGGTEIDRLQAQKAAQQTDYMDALDKNDLAGAKRIEGLIAETDEQIAALEDEANARMSDLEEQIAALREQLADETEDGTGEGDGTGQAGAGGPGDGSGQTGADGTGDGSGQAGADGSGDGSGQTGTGETGQTGAGSATARQIQALEGELSALAASLSGNTAGSLVGGLRGASLAIVRNGGDLDELGSSIDSLGAMLDTNFKLIFPALNDIYAAMKEKSALDGDHSFDAAIAAVEQLILDNKTAYDAAMAQERAAAEFDDLSKAYFASAPAELQGLGTEEQAAVYLGALKAYSEQVPGDTAGRLMQAEAQRQMNLGNPLVFRRINDPASEYLPVTSIASFLKMRYVWNRNLNQAVLERGAAYYIFTTYSDQVLRSKDSSQTEYMRLPAKYLSCVHVPEEYAQANFSCEAVYFPGTEYGMLFSEKFQAACDGLLEQLLT